MWAGHGAMNLICNEMIRDHEVPEWGQQLIRLAQIDFGQLGFLGFPPCTLQFGHEAQASIPSVHGLQTINYLRGDQTWSWSSKAGEPTASENEIQARRLAGTQQ